MWRKKKQKKTKIMQGKENINKRKTIINILKVREAIAFMKSKIPKTNILRMRKSSRKQIKDKCENKGRTS